VNPTTMKTLNYLWKSHAFFIRESYPYSGTAFVRHPIQWLRAYFRFMADAIKDARHFQQGG